MAMGKSVQTGSASGGAAKSRLGRGLNSMIRVSVPEPTPQPAATPPAAAGAPAQVSIAEPAGEPLHVPVADIRPNPHQPRKTFTDGALKELAESIRSNGVIQPLVVRKQGDHYELIAGERRLRASKLAGLATVPCHVKTVDGLTQAQMALVENIQREDLNPLERAEGYRTLLTQLGLTQSELAGRLGEDRSTIANFVRLLELAEPVKKMLRDGQLTLGHAKLLAGVADILQQQKLAELVVSQALSVRSLEKVIQQGGNSPPAASSKTPVAGRDAHYAQLEQSLARQLGLRVQLRPARGKGKGKITLHYGSLDQFDQLMARLNVDVE